MDPMAAEPAPSLTEADIKALARVNEVAARQLLFARYRPRLEYHAGSILRDAAEAGDVVQEVFIKAMREPRMFDPEFKTQAWLYRVTRNLCFNIVRDRRRRGAILSTMPREQERPDDPLDAVFSGERREELVALVGQLTEDHRCILMLRYYEDLSYTEIAARLDIKMGTVMSRLSRARGRLEEVLGHDGDPLLAAS